MKLSKTLMKKKKKELLRLVVDPLDGEYVNKDINPSDYTKDDNNNTIPTNTDSSVLCYK